MEDQNNQHDRIEHLRKSLYSRQGPPKLRKYISLRARDFGIKEDWAPEGDQQEDGVVPTNSVFKNIFIGAVVFFVIAIIVAGYISFRGDNIISSNNISVSVLGQTTAAAGEPVSLDINVANKNAVDLQLVDLVIQYPQGTKTADGSNQDMPRDRISLGGISAGQTVRKTINAILYGQQGDTEGINISVEYHLAGSNAVYHADKKYELAISSSPVSLSINSLKEINSGQELVIDAKLNSNSTNIIKGLLLKVDFPPGFQYESATPTPSSASNVWSIGDLEPNGSRDFQITGKVNGQDNDQRVFRFYTGTQSDSDPLAIGTAFIDTTQAVVIHKPFLGTTLSFNSSSDDPFIGQQHKTINGEIKWSNNLTDSLKNIVIDAVVTSTYLNQASVSADNAGFYNSNTNTVEWNSAQNDMLTDVSPGQSGKVSFQFATNDLSGQLGASVKNPTVNVSISVKGRRFNENNVPEDITGTLSRTIKLSANLGLDAETSHDQGVFKNTGPIPPKVGLPTSYTITWKASDSLNDVKNAYVTATLPSYVDWLTQVSPSGSALTYNPVTRQIRWDIGSLPAGSGYGLAAKQVSFMVSLTPSVSQVTKAPDLVDDIALFGGDTFTGKEVQTELQNVTTMLAGDTSNALENARVVQ